MNILELFTACLKASYIQVENAGSYALEKIGNTLYIYLEGSNGVIDWKNNFDFFPKVRRNIWRNAVCCLDIFKSNCSAPVKPYKDMEYRWFSHRGFLRVWKSIEPYIAAPIEDRKFKKIIIVGYSHGAALAVLCHEYVWYHRPDLREKIEGYGIGCPRVFWGIQTAQARERWARFYVIRNIDDIVTHVPPVWLGFSHVGNLISIGTRGKYSRIDAHRSENILEELNKYIKRN
jgi:hypothetical protein